MAFEKRYGVETIFWLDKSKSIMEKRQWVSQVTANRSLLRLTKNHSNQSVYSTLKITSTQKAGWVNYG